MASGIIIEGVSGAGKTQTLHALQLPGDVNIFREKETFGDFGVELRDPNVTREFLTRRLRMVLETIEHRAKTRPNYRFIIERAHFSYYAMLPEWDLYADMDARLAALGARTMLLTFPATLLRERSLHRVDRQRLGPIIARHYGSEAVVLKNYEDAIRLRLKGIECSALPFEQIDTTEKTWEKYAVRMAEILAGA